MYTNVFSVLSLEWRTVKKSRSKTLCVSLQKHYTVQCTQMFLLFSVLSYVSSCVLFCFHYIGYYLLKILGETFDYIKKLG